MNKMDAKIEARLGLLASATIPGVDTDGDIVCIIVDAPADKSAEAKENEDA